MKQHFTDGKTGIRYTLQGDYYLPDLTLPIEEQQPIGIWGQREIPANINITTKAKHQCDVKPRRHKITPGFSESLEWENFLRFGCELY